MQRWGLMFGLLGLVGVAGACAGGKDGRARGDGGTLCDSDDACDDGIDCTVDTCGVGGSCRFEPVDGLCADGETCSPTRGCGTTEDCSSDAECDDSLDCTVDSCGVDMTCRHMALNELCDPGQMCDPAMGCIAGTGCTGDADCDDEIDCTLDSCGVDMTCRHMAIDDRCAGGESCSPTIGCYTPMPCDTADECQDDNFCNGAEVCMPEFGCAPAPSPRMCNDSEDCTIDTCDTDADMCVFACDTSRTECECPTPSATCEGTFDLSPAPTYSCYLGIVNYDFSTTTFTNSGGVLTVSPASSSFPDLADAMSPVCPEFEASVEVAGGCKEIYTISGTFTDDDTLMGVVEAEFVDTMGSGMCAAAGCTNQSHSFTGSRR